MHFAALQEVESDHIELSKTVFQFAELKNVKLTSLCDCKVRNDLFFAS